MEIFIENQLKNIGYSIILGLIFGAFYDIISIIHITVGILSFSGESRHPEHIFRRDRAARAVFFVTDLFYMLEVTGMLSVFLYEFASGDLRMYLLIAAAVGFALYRCTAGRLVMALSETIVQVIRKVVRVIVIRPVLFILRILRKFAAWLYRHTFGMVADGIRYRYGLFRLECAKKKLAREIRME